MSALDARNRLHEAQVLDLYAGTGALGIEALSRGASTALFVDRNPSLLREIERMGQKLESGDRLATIQADLTRKPQPSASRIAEVDPRFRPFSLIFMDPPYADVAATKDLIPALRAHDLLAPDACLVLEHGQKTPPPQITGLAMIKQYRYGDSVIRLLVLEEQERE